MASWLPMGGLFVSLPQKHFGCLHEDKENFGSPVGGYWENKTLQKLCSAMKTLCVFANIVRYNHRHRPLRAGVTAQSLTGGQKTHASDDRVHKRLVNVREEQNTVKPQKPLDRH